jgi:hypothetical protein
MLATQTPPDHPHDKPATPAQYDIRYQFATVYTTCFPKFDQVDTEGFSVRVKLATQTGHIAAVLMPDKGVRLIS